MSRVITFRGKTESFKEEDYEYEGEWIYGFHHVDTKSVHFIIENSKTGRMYPGREIVPDSVGQFTGLKDKNGKDIYEGDILKWTSWKKDTDPYNNVVEFFAGGQMCGFRIRNKSFFKSLTYNGILNAKAIVIGNIHENPELLTL